MDPIIGRQRTLNSYEITSRAIAYEMGVIAKGNSQREN